MRTKQRIGKRIGILLIVLVLLLTGLTQTLSQDQNPTQKLLYLSVEKPWYELGEKVTLIITTGKLDQYELSITSPENYYKFSGELSNNIDFYPKEQGMHTVELTEIATNSLADSLDFTVGKPETETTTPLTEIIETSIQYISTDKETYTIGETVNAVVDIPREEKNNYKVYYEYEGLSQRYMGDYKQISFVPKGIGTHYLVLTDLNNNEVERHGFEVQQNENHIQPEKKAMLKPLKSQFKQKEDAVFDFEFEVTEKNPSLIRQKQIGTWQTTNEKIRVELTDNKGEKQDAVPEIERIEDGKFQIKIPKKRAIRPGAYLLNVELEKDNETIMEQQEFLWGVLAINTHKSIYLPGEEAFIGIAVLDDSGHMVCDANVTLEIVGPAGSSTILRTSDGTIVISPQCTFYGVTDLPDYYTTYKVNKTGNYTMRLSAVTKQGVRDLTDVFVVQANVDYDVERQGPTRTFPEVPYTMNFAIKANQDYTGPVIEYVPADFIITPQAGLTITTADDTKVLTWNQDFVADQTYAFGYEFDAPEVSPYLYTLGPLEIGSWKEARNWMIANDGTMYDDSNTENDTAIDEGESIQIDTQYDNYKNDVYWVAMDASGTKLLDNGCVGGADFYMASVDLTNCNVDATCSWDGTNDHVIVNSGNPGQTNSHIYWNIVSCSGSAGSYTFQCDDDGGTDTVTCDAASNTVTVTAPPADDSPIVVSLDNPEDQANITTAGQIDFNFTARDDSGFDNCTLYTNYTGSWEANESTASITNNSENKIGAYLPEGNYIWNIRCWDNATTPQDDWFTTNYSLRVDRSGPNVTIDNPDNQTNISASTYKVNATVTDMTEIDTWTVMYRQNATTNWVFACNDDRGSVYDCDWSLGGLPDGNTYEIRAYANDTFGQVGDNDTRYNITVDRIGPVSTLDRPAQGGTINTSTYTVNASITDTYSPIDTATFEYRENESASWKPICTDNRGPTYDCEWNLLGYSEQNTYQVRVIANDTLGNTGSYDTHTNIIVGVPPEIENSSASPQKTGIGQQVTISADIADSGGISKAWIIITRPDDVNVTGDMTNVGGNEYQYNYTPYQTGTYKYTIKANDTDGNLETLDPYFYVFVEASILVLIENESYVNDEPVELIPGYVNWSTDQESGVQSIKAQQEEMDIFTATGGSLIPFGVGYDVSDGSYTDTQSDNSVYYAVGRDNGPGIGNTNDLKAYINLTYNISSIGVDTDRINQLIFNINFCHTDDISSPITCTGPLDGTPVNPANFDLYNYDLTTWETKDNFIQNASLDGEQDINFTVSSAFSDYLDSYGLVARYETDISMEQTDDTSFAMDYAVVYVNYTKLDDEGSYEYINYTGFGGAAMPNMTAFDIVLTVNHFNGSGSMQAGNKMPDLQVNVYTGSAYTLAGNCELNKTLDNLSTTDVNCTVTVTDASIISEWASTPASRQIQIRGINFDEENGQADEINYSDVRIKYYSGSLIPNHNNFTLSGYLLMTVAKNESGTYTYLATVINDTNGGTIRNISAYDTLNIGSIWNTTGFNTNYTDPGYYIINASFTDENGTIITDDDGIYLTGFDQFALDYIKINITSPLNNTIQDAQGFDVNATISYENYGSGGACQYSIDGGANISMDNLSSTQFSNTTTSTLSLGNHNITVYCNDTRGIWFSSRLHNFSVTDQRGPNVTQITPEHNAQEEDGDITFYFNVTDVVSGVQNCTIILDYTNRQNTTYNVTEDTTLNFTVTGLSYETHVWQIECYDNSTNNNKGLSEIWTFLVGNDTTPPDVTLDSPIPSFNTTSPEVSFNYTVVDTQSDIKNCSLIINGSINQTNSSIQTGEEAVNYFNGTFGIGSYNWSVNCTDIRDNTGKSEWRIFRILNDTDYPIILLESPAPDYVDTDGDLTFMYNVTDASSDIVNCSLVINDNINQTNSSITEGTTQYFYLNNVGDGATLNWSVNCTDASANKNKNRSEFRNLTINIVSDIVVSVTTNKTEYQIGEIMEANTTVEDSVGADLPANVTTDIIKGNATRTWWNESWARRKPIILSSGTTLTNALIEINITGLGGNITSCQNEIRVIQNQSDNSFVSANRTIVSGDNNDYCVVRFKANITSGINNTDFYVYYNNSNALNPNNDITRENQTLQRVGDGGSIIAGAAGYDITDGSYSDTTSDNSAYYAVGRENTGSGAGAENDDLEAYINISYNLSGIEFDEDDITLLNFTINFCHTADVTAPITCSDAPKGSANNPANTFLYNFDTDTWDIYDSFTQDDASSTEQTVSLTQSTSIADYVHNTTNKIWVRYETDISLDSSEDVSFALDYSSMNVDYEEKIYDNLSTLQGPQVFVTRKYEAEISGGAAGFGINTSNFTTGAHSAVSKAEMTAYRTTFDYNFFNMIEDTYGPTINLLSPADNNYSLVRDINFTYTATDTGHNIANCELIINNAVNQTNSSITEGATEWFYVTDLPDGQYNWSVNCTDTLGYENASTETRNLTIGGDLVAPEITLYKPSNNTPFLTGSTIVFNYSANDVLNALASCELIINGSVFNTTNSPPESTVINFTTSTLGDGNYSWNINCTDDSSNSNEGISELRNFSIGADETGPTIQLKSPSNGGQVDNGNVTLTYNVTDVLSDIKNCTIWVFNSTFDQVYTNFTSSVTENTNLYFYTYNLADGLHYWNMSCWDNASTPNQNNSQTYNFTIATDTEAPTVTLVSPPDEFQDVDGDVIFYFNVTEDITEVANCSLIFNDSIYTTINTSDITNSATNNFTIWGLEEATYFWKVNCSDTAALGSNIGTSAETWNLTVRNDTQGPTITLYNPPPGVQDTDGNVTFEFSATDYASGIDSCILVFNGSTNHTWNTVVEDVTYNHTLTYIANGNYTWHINCTDNSTNSNEKKSEVRALEIGADVTAPTIVLVSPANNTKNENGNITFIYNVTDYASDVTNCSLIINGTQNKTDDSITEGVAQYFYLYNIGSDIQFDWRVDCTDNAPIPNTGSSNTSNISVVLPKAMVTDIITDKTSYVLGKTVETTTNTTNGTGSLIDSNINVDIVRGNAMAPWWDTSWTYRVPVTVETGSYDRHYLLLEKQINFTSVLVNDLGLTGKTLDTNSIRVVEWEGDNDTKEIPSYLIQADNFDASSNALENVTWIMNGSVPANTNKTYHIYFDTTDSAKSAPSYPGPSYSFMGSEKDVNYDGAATTADYVIISQGDQTFSLQFADGDSLPNQQHIKKQGAGAIWNITVNSTKITNDNSSIVPVSIAVNDSLTTDETSSLKSGQLSRIDIPGQINTVSPSNFTLNYTIWFGREEIFVKAKLNASFGSAENNNYAFENTWFSYLFDDDGSSGWANYLNKMQSPAKNQTHDYQGVQENTYNTHYAGDWYREYSTNSSTKGSVGLVLDVLNVNSAAGTKGIVTFDDNNDGEETDMVGFSDNGNPDIATGDNYEVVVWMIFTQRNDSTRTTDFRDGIINPITITAGAGHEHITRSSGSTTSGFYYYNFSTSGRTIGNYSAISGASQTDYVNASAYAWFEITADTIAPNVTLNSPSGWLNYDDINFSFYVAEGGSGINNCSLYLNGSYFSHKNSSDITDFDNNTINVTDLGEGEYNWTVYCYDNSNNLGNDTELNITIDITNPIVNISYPQDGDTIADSTPLFNFTINDTWSNPNNYTVYVDGSSNGQYGNASNATIKSINISTLSDGTYNITIKGTDQAGNSANDTIEITIDTNAPTVNFENQTGTWWNTSTPEIFFNITDSVDDNLDYVLYINNSPDQSGSVDNYTSTSETLSAQIDGSYNITIQATDNSSNAANYSIIIYIDTTKPKLNLTYPADGANITETSASLNFTVTDNIAGNILCNLTLDDTLLINNTAIGNDTNYSVSASDLTEATHYWNVTCWDNASNTNTSETRSFNIFIPPVVNLTRPEDNNVSSNLNQVLYFNVSDDTGIENCSLYLNGQWNTSKTPPQITNNAENNFTITLAEGEYNWSVKCFDNTSQLLEANSENWTITIDQTAPTPNITTANYTWFNTSSPSIDFIITDNVADPINYTFYVNSSTDATGTTSNNSADSDTLTSTNSNSSFRVILQTTDDVGNSANSSSIIIYVDTVKPNINLSKPDNGQVFNTNSVQFNFTITDNMAKYTMCNLTISNGMYEYNINSTNNTLQNITKSGFTSGTYFWNVTCLDFANNTNTSVTWNFTIEAPDLTITTGNITFNDSSPEENKNITIYANIFNIGGSPASDVIVQFWNGDPDGSGTKINGNKTISTLNNDANFTVNVTYNVSIGTNNIFVVVDPPTLTNGTIDEENESNNKANNSFGVELYQVYAGNITTLIDLEKQSINISIFQWNISNSTGSNIYVTDLEASPDFTNLQAISRDTSNNSVTGDFEEIDAALGSTTYSDSVNTTFTTDNSPKETRSFEVFTKDVNNVPVINSTNSSNFKTGILWDKSDGHTEYNGTQDLIFITEVNEQQQGSQGIYDFEIKIPALLRNYNAAGNSIAFYAEIK